LALNQGSKSRFRADFGVIRLSSKSSQMSYHSKIRIFHHKILLTPPYGFSIFGDLNLGPQASPEKRVVPFDSARRDESNGMGLI